MVTRDGGLHRVAERKVTALSPPETAGSIMINSACVTRDGNIWVGTDDAGAFRYQDGGFVQFTNGLTSVHVGVLFEDSRTNLWAGTRQGLHRWDGTRFLPVLGTDAPGFWIYALHEDAQGNLWGGSNDRGLFRRAPTGEIRYYGREAGLDHYFIRAIIEDAEGRICLAVWERGLYRLAGEKFERFAADRWPGLAPHPRPLPRPGGWNLDRHRGRGGLLLQRRALPPMDCRRWLARHAPARSGCRRGRQPLVQLQQGHLRLRPRGAAPIPAGQKPARALLAAFGARRLARQAGFRDLASRSRRAPTMDGSGSPIIAPWPALIPRWSGRPDAPCRP